MGEREDVFKMYITELSDVLKENWWPDILEEYQDRMQVFFKGERFQPSKMVIESLRSKAENYKTGDEPIDSFKVKLLSGYLCTYSDRESFETDIDIFVEYFCEQDKMYIRNRNEIDKGYKELIKALKQKYEIADNREAGTMLAADTLTIYRLVRCFPNIVCKFYHERKSLMSKPIFSAPWQDLFRETSGALLSPVLASCIPPEWIDIENNVHLQFFYIYTRVDGIRFLKKRLGVKLLFNQYMYTYSNPVLSSLERKEFCKSIGLANEKGDGFAEDILMKNLAAEYLIRCEIKDDQNLNMVIRKLKNLKEIPEDQDWEKYEKLLSKCKCGYGN